MDELSYKDVALVSAGLSWQDVVAIGDFVADFAEGFKKGWDESKAHALT